MAYGDRGGRKAPGEYGIGDYLAFAFAGSVGILVATLTDLTQSGEASALFRISIFISQSLGMEFMPFYAIILLLMGIGAGSIMFLQPVTMREAFLEGFAILAAVMTIVPGNYADGTPPLQPMPQEETDSTPELEAKIQSVTGTSDDIDADAPNGRVETVAFQDGSAVIGYNVTIRIDFPNGLRGSISEMIRKGTLRGRLYNSSTNTSYDLFRNGGADATLSGNRLVIRTTIPGTEDSTKLWARVETVGYAIALESFDARQGRNVAWDIPMTPSNTPLFLQRLTNSYWF